MSTTLLLKRHFHRKKYAINQVYLKNHVRKVKGVAFLENNQEYVMNQVCVLSVRLVTGGIPPGHFSHVFVDEAGHAVETECIIPLAGTDCPSMCVLF